VNAELTNSGDADVALDRGAATDQAWDYRLAARDGGRVLVLGEPVTVAAAPSVFAFALTRAVPNPATGPQHIGFTLPREADVDVSVFDVAGRCVATLVHGNVAAGAHETEWRGPVPAGVYLVKYRHPGGVTTARLVRMN
jgi:hypothetical protein